MIVIEGMDNSGKSTLAQALAHALSAPVQGSEGPPKYPGEMLERLERYSRLPPDTIFDRHPMVSDPIYNILRRSNPIPQDLIQKFYDSRPLFVYCDPGDRHLLGHRERATIDSSSHLAQLKDNYPTLIALYRVWAIEHAHFVYRIGDDTDRLVSAIVAHIGRSFEPMRDIEQFHQRYQLDYVGPPRELSEEVAEFRLAFMAEELCEYVNLSNMGTQLVQSALVEGHTPGNLERKFDALIDLVYVALGTAYLHGFNFREGWRRVQEANLRKIRAATASDSRRGSSYDVVKPPDWQPPVLTDLV